MGRDFLRRHILKKLIFCAFVSVLFSCASLKTAVVDNPSPEEKKDQKIKEKEVINKSIENTKTIEKVEPITLQKLIKEKKTFTLKDEKLQFCQTVNENQNLFDSLELKKISFPNSTSADQPFNQDFTLKVELHDKDLIKNMEFIVEYPVKKDGSIVYNYEKLTANENEEVSFKAPKSAQSIDSNLTISVNLLKTDDLKEDMLIFNENVKEELKNKLKVSFDYKVSTPNRRVSAAIAILDYDQNQKALLQDNKVANRLFVKMMRQGFSRTGLAPFASLAKLDDALIVEDAKRFFNGSIDYYIYGKTYIKSIEKDSNGMWICNITGSLCVWNLKQNKKVFECNVTNTGKSKTKEDAILKARTALGEESMYNKILYNL